LESKVATQKQNIEELEKKMKTVAKELDIFQNELQVDVRLYNTQIIMTSVATGSASLTRMTH